MSELLDIDQFREVLPKHVASSVSSDMLNKLNSSITDPAFRENYRNNLISYTNVLTMGKFKIDSYLDAVRYVSFRLLQHTVVESYVKTFPDKAQHFRANSPTGYLDKYAYAYNKNKLVGLIMDQAMMPVHVLNADKFQEAINVQAKLMVDDDVSPKVRSDAANSLLTHLKPPTETKIELDIGVSQTSVIGELRGSIDALVRQQRSMLKDGTTAEKDLRESPVIINPGVGGEDNV